MKKTDLLIYLNDKYLTHLEVSIYESFPGISDIKQLNMAIIATQVADYTDLDHNKVLKVLIEDPNNYTWKIDKFTLELDIPHPNRMLYSFRIWRCWSDNEDYNSWEKDYQHHFEVPAIEGEDYTREEIVNKIYEALKSLGLYTNDKIEIGYIVPFEDPQEIFIKAFKGSENYDVVISVRTTL